jgi:integrase/recombinase XerD
MNIGKYIDMYSRDLRLKNYCDRTITNYVGQVKIFLNAFDGVATKPSEISESKIKDWLLTAKCVNSQKHMMCAVKLFYEITGKQPNKFKFIKFPRSEKKLPVVLSQMEVQSMFKVCENLKHKVILALLYSSGLRVSELINLKWSNIDRSRNVIYIIQAKGNKDRTVPLSANLVPLLVLYYRQYKTKEYILAGQFGDQYSERSVGQVLKQLAQKAGIKKRVWTHQMRHNAFTHMVENGIDINLIQKIAGHSSPKTTQIYTHISSAIISNIPSPLDFITL